jgi:High potential iron-sulfur protein
MSVANDKNVVSRRRILWGGVLAAAVAAAAAPTAALTAQSKPPKKMSQAAVNYQARPKNGAYCLGCKIYQSPNECALVEGSVSPNGWCALFTPK